MVAEFVGRSQSGSPINGEIPQLNSNMPASHGREMLAASTTPGADGYNSSYNMNVKHKDLFSQRKQREFTPDNKKDDSYWDRRRRNNEAAKRSREKRRYNDMILEKRVVELTKENAILKAQLEAIKDEYGICGENIVSMEKVLATLPTNEQVLSLTKRQKFTHVASPMMFGAQSPIPTSVIHQPVIGSPSPQPLQHAHNMLHSVSPHVDSHSHNHNLSHNHNHNHNHYREHPEYTHPSYAYQPFHPNMHYDSNNALNLSARSRSRSPSRSRSRSRDQSPFEVSSNSGDEGAPIALTYTAEQNNSLPLKLRHKSHLGDKDAASALLSLQNIKQEPCPRASPPWDGEGSSDERDSGISLGAEWSAATQAAATLQTLQKQSKLQAMQEVAVAVAVSAARTDSDPDADAEMAATAAGDSEVKHILHSELVRLSTEVAHLKSIVCKDKDIPAGNRC